MYYVAVIERGKSGFGVFFPDVPGCTSFGATVQAAAANAAEALALHFEGSDERPEPSAPDAITIDPDIDVVATVMVPAPESDGPVKRYNVTLPSGLVTRIDRRVGAGQRSAFLASAARRALAS